MKVFTTGIRKASANLRSSSDAPERITPLPARITGFDEPLIKATALATASLVTAEVGLERGFFKGTRLLDCEIFSDATSSGSSMCVAPIFSDSATEKALRTT